MRWLPLTSCSLSLRARVVSCPRSHSHRALESRSEHWQPLTMAAAIKSRMLNNAPPVTWREASSGVGQALSSVLFPSRFFIRSFIHSLVNLLTHSIVLYYRCVLQQTSCLIYIREIKLPNLYVDPISFIYQWGRWGPKVQVTLWRSDSQYVVSWD